MNQNLLILMLFCFCGQLSGQSVSITDSIRLSNEAQTDKQPDTLRLAPETQRVSQSDDTNRLTIEAQRESDTLRLAVSARQLSDSLRLVRDIQRFKMDSVDYKIHTSSYFEAEGNYMSNIRYSGRDYGVKGYGLSTQLSLKHKSGLWLSAIAYNWQAFDIPIPKSDFVVGYAKQLGSRVGGSVSYSRWVYYGKSQSELRWAFNHFMSMYMGINATYFTIAPQIYYMISPGENVAQFAISISKTKEWRPFYGGKLIVEPSLTWMSSTKDRFNSSDPTLKAGKILRVIDYELTLPLIYRRVGKYEISPRYVLSLPVNVTPFDGVKEGKLTSVFSLNFKYILWHKK